MTLDIHLLPGRDPMWSHAKAIVSCEAKIAFRSRGRALIFAAVRRLRQRPYRSPICGEWHLTKGERS